MPSFQDVGLVWLKSIKQKEIKIIIEIEEILSSFPFIEEADLSELSIIIDGIFSELRYVDRLVKFKEGVIRSVARYGCKLPEQRICSDITEATYRAGVINLLGATRKIIKLEIEVLISNRSVYMEFSSLMTDRVGILKKSGKKYENISASVQSGKIFINESEILIETGDLINRNMSNGGQETFEVIDPGFHEKFHSIPAGYQIEVRKLGLPEAKAAIQNITYNISGSNARVNHSSIDNSTNTIYSNSLAFEYLAKLRQAIEETTAPGEKVAAFEVVEAIETQFKSGAPSKPVVSALLAALPHAANIATVISMIQGML